MKSTLGHIAQFKGGSAFPRDEQGNNDGQLPFMKVSDLAQGTGAWKVNSARNWLTTDQLATLRPSVAPTNSIVFAKIGEGMKSERFRILTRPAAIDNNMMAAEPINGIHPIYLYYLLKSLRLSRHAVGSALPYLKQSTLSMIAIETPPIAEQTAIAEVLGALDDKIATNVRVAETADLLRTTMYREALRTDAPRTGLFMDYFDVTYGSAFKGSHFTEPGIGRALIRIRDLKTSTPQTWTSEARDDETVVQPGDVVVGMDAEFTPTAWLGEPGLLNQRVCILKSQHTDAFTLEAAREPLAFIEGYKTGTTVIHLNKRDLTATQVTLPSEAASNRFDSQAPGLLRATVARHAENRSLAATRDTLLPALMSGKLRVKDAERQVEEVV